MYSGERYFNQKLLAKSFLFLSVFSTSVLAAPSFETNAISDTIPSGLQSMPQGPATTGSITSVVNSTDGVDRNFGAPAYAVATANESGESSLKVEGIFFQGTPSNLLESSAVYTEQFTNTSAVDWNFEYSFLLGNPTLLLTDYAGLTHLGEPNIDVYFDFMVSLDFGTGATEMFSSNAHLEGGAFNPANHILTTGGSNPLPANYFVNAPYEIGYELTGFSGDLAGTAAPGETVTITMSILLGLETPGFETGGAAWMGDPFGPGSIPGLISGELVITPVPELETWAMMIAGMGFLGWRLRKKS